MRDHRLECTWPTATGSYLRLRPTASSGRISSSRLPSAFQRPFRYSNTAVARRAAAWSNGTALEVDADQGEEVAGLPVACPEDLVVPVGLFPPRALDGIDPPEHGDEPGLQPLAVVVERLAGLVDVKVLEEEPEGPLQQEDRRDQADGQDASPDQPTHVRTPGHFPGS